MKIGIVGCAGRMGRMLLAEILGNDKTTLAGATEAPGNDVLGQDPGTLVGLDTTGLAISDDADRLFDASDAVIDFTAPKVTLGHAELAVSHKTILVVGTTGFEAHEQTQLEAFSDTAVVFQAANFSVGVNLLLGLSEQVGTLLGDDFDAEILEMHHKHKVDAPSGTALALGKAVAKGRGVDLDTVAQRSRDGITGARKAGDIGFATLRGGAVIGDHTVMFAAGGERIELTHKASNRAIYSAGAVRATLWCEGKANGFYDMKEMLGFK
jgi:4-hydroxy-tetrahydrodipicolinate reductase